jgi:hypothetical protein
VTVTYLGQKEMSVSDLHPHPENPNHGDVNQIAESLETHGQYRSVVANKDGTLLAGHHVWQAAKNIGVKTLRVDVLDADENEARKILLADNRLAELGPGMDMDVLLDVLTNLNGDLTGTGFDEKYLEMLEEMVAGAPPLDDLEKEAGGAPTDEDFMSRLLLVVEKPLMQRWSIYRENFDNDTDAVQNLLNLDDEAMEVGRGRA